MSYFNPDYSINTNHQHQQPHLQPQPQPHAPIQAHAQAQSQMQVQNQYRPSPLGNGNEPSYNDSGLQQDDYDALIQSLSHEDLSALVFTDPSIPPPRQSESHYHTQPQANTYVPQQLYEYAQASVNANATGHHGNGHGNGNMSALDTPCTDALQQYLNASAHASMYPSYGAPPLPETSAQGTISPSQLGQGVLSKQFSSLYMSRGSSSSASSTEGGHDWTNTPNLLGEETQVPSNLSYSTNMASFNTPPATAIPHHISNGNGNVQLGDSNPAVRTYLTAPNRFAYGERKLVISTPKVGQKSYGNEKRFLCPHPQATLYGGAWWTTQGEGSPAPTILPPRVNISLSGEEAVKDASVSWSTIDGKNLDDKINVEPIFKQEQPFVGNVAGRSLHVSDSDGKRSTFNARVRIRAPSANAEPGPSTGKGTGKWNGGKPVYDMEAPEIIGSFDSKDIKIISKPSKKKTNTKSSERRSRACLVLSCADLAVVITHGSTVALYNRTKSQTASTRYLNVESDLTNIRGSDGQHITGARPPLSASEPRQNPFKGLVSSAGVWESFIIWLVDPSKPLGPSNLPPAQPGWPVQPLNALITGQVLPPIRYNALVILQSLQSGQCTQPMVIRRIDQDTDAVGQDGNWADHSCGYAPENEMLGDMVAQVQKVAFELYNPILSSQVQHNRSSGDSRWLACDHDAVHARYVRSERRWSPIPIPYRGGKSHSTPTTPNRSFHVLPMTPHDPPANLPPSTPSSPISSGSSLDYFGSHSRKASSTNLMSPISSNGEALPHVSTDGGPLRRQRTGSTGRAGPLGRPAHKKRQSQDSHSASSSYDHLPNALGNILEQRQSWSLSVGDVAVWYVICRSRIGK
jgi:recombining binding protein (suppressor of hairless)